MVEAEVPDGMHEVQSILRRRAKGGGRDVEYLIRWRGYGADHDTWEPKANLVEHCDDMIRAFEVERAAEEAAAPPPAARKRSRMDGGGLAELPAWRGSFEAATAGMAVAEVAGVAAAAVAAAANAASAAAGGGAEDGRRSARVGGERGGGGAAAGASQAEQLQLRWALAASVEAGAR